MIGGEARVSEGMRMRMVGWGRLLMGVRQRVGVACCVLTALGTKQGSLIKIAIFFRLHLS